MTWKSQLPKKDIYWEVKTERKDDVSLAGSFKRATCQEFEKKDIKLFDISPKYQKIFIRQYEEGGDSRRKAMKIKSIGWSEMWP